MFISGGENGVSLSFCEKGGVALSRENIRKLEEILSSGEFNRTSGADCHNVSVIESIEKTLDFVSNIEDFKPSMIKEIFSEQDLVKVASLMDSISDSFGEIGRKI